jgi:hypothetical protein
MFLSGDIMDIQYTIKQIDALIGVLHKIEHRQLDKNVLDEVAELKKSINSDVLKILESLAGLNQRVQPLLAMCPEFNEKYELAAHRIGQSFQYNELKKELEKYQSLAEAVKNSILT